MTCPFFDPKWLFEQILSGYYPGLCEKWQWNVSRNDFIHENAFGNVACEVVFSHLPMFSVELEAGIKGRNK